MSGRAIETLGSAPKSPGVESVRFNARGHVLVPHCNGRTKVLVDGAVKDDGSSKGPLVLDLEGDGDHEITVEVKVSTYEKRIACSHPPRAGARIKTIDGLSLMRFASPSKEKGGGEAVVFVPGGHDPKKPATLLVGLHPWNGNPWTYAAYSELLDEAGRRDVVLLMPSGLGNSLYVADAEEEAMRAIEAVQKELAIDPQRISLWGASMGGQGATTIGFHRPDRFAFIASYFGDSRFDLTTYVRGILGGEEGAKKVNALDVLENSRHVPVFLVHGENDHTSPMKQSTMLFDAMKKAGFDVELERVPGMAHEGPLVIKYIRKVVERASRAVAPTHPSHVTFRSVRAVDTEAYKIRIVRERTEGDAFIDISLRDDGIHLDKAEGVKEVVLLPGALGAKATDKIHPSKVPVRWQP